MFELTADGLKLLSDPDALITAISFPKARRCFLYFLSLPSNFLGSTKGRGGIFFGHGSDGLFTRHAQITRFGNYFTGCLWVRRGGGSPFTGTCRLEGEA